MDCSVCGQPGAWKCLAVDEYNNPAGDWVHPHCYPKHGDSFIECNRLGTSRYHSFSRVKKIAVQRMRRGSSLLYRLGGGRSRWPL